MTTPIYTGYVTVNEFDAEDIFALCNWSQWADDKPKNFHCNISSCGHGLLLLDDNGEYWLSLSSGWKTSYSLQDIQKYVNKHVNMPIWN